MGGNRGKVHRDSTIFRRAIRLPRVVSGLFGGAKGESVSTINISCTPEQLRNSCVPYFLAKVSTTATISETLSIPLCHFSRRRKRVTTTLCSTNELRLLGRPFVTFRMSKNAARTILMGPSGRRVVGTRVITDSSSLGTNRTVSHIKIVLSLGFPTKPRLRGLSRGDGTMFGVGPSVGGASYSLSKIRGGYGGVLARGCRGSSVTLFYVSDIVTTLSNVCGTLVPGCKTLPIIFSNNIASGGEVGGCFRSGCGTVFTRPTFSTSGTTNATILSSVVCSQEGWYEVR